MATMNISLPDGMREFVESEIERGGFSTASEYIRQLIRDDQDRKAQRRLEELLLAGLESEDAGEMTAQDWADIRSDVRRRLGARAIP